MTPPISNPLKHNAKWTHDEAVVALGLYFQIPFNRINSRNPQIRKVAHVLGRSPASLSMKMDNFGRLDPSLSARGIGGLKNGAKMDREVWDEFSHRREDLAVLFHELLSRLGGTITEADDTLIKTPLGLDAVRLTKYRVNQTFFRTSVLSAYDNTCCITGLTEPALLIASHIKPWSKCENGQERTDASNGLCLNPLHDRAFDKGLITLDEQFRVVLSSLLKEATPHIVFNEYFGRYEGLPITLPSRGRPSATFLEYHRQYIFRA